MGGLIYGREAAEDWYLDSDYAEERHDERIQKNYRRQMNSHPSCRDPDHPGCTTCEPELFGEEEDEE